jgi:hypothetical protein
VYRDVYRGHSSQREQNELGSDRYGFNFEVNNLKPFSKSCFSVLTTRENSLKRPGFGDALMTSFSARAEMKSLRPTWQFGSCQVPLLRAAASNAGIQPRCSVVSFCSRLSRWRISSARCSDP